MEKFVHSKLGPDILDEMQGSGIFTTRMSFKYSILKDLISNEQFDKFKNYICSYEDFVKSWIFDSMEKHFSNNSKLSDYENRHIQSALTKITDAIQHSEAQNPDSLETFVNIFLDKLQFNIDKKALEDFMILNNADLKRFAVWLKQSVNDIDEVLRQKFEKEDFKTKIENLNTNPQSFLFEKVFGCGKLCPFCAEPCEATGEGHTEHFASLHRPQGIGQYMDDSTKKLVTDICTSLVSSNRTFNCKATNNKWHPYKDYRSIYPDWHIPPDKSIYAADYWKYVMAKYNQNFADSYDAEPADIPSAWKKIKPEKAKESLEKSYNKK